jgi:hypothetical protein
MLLTASRHADPVLRVPKQFLATQNRPTLVDRKSAYILLAQITGADNEQDWREFLSSRVRW